MSKQKSTIGSRGVAALTVIAVFALMWGCGSLDQSLLTSTDGTGVQAVANSPTAVTGSTPVLKGNSFAIAFGPKALAKTTGGSEENGTYVRWVQDEYGVDAAGGMGVDFPVYGSESTVRVLDARFEAKKNSIHGLDPNGPDGLYAITMEVYSRELLTDVLVKCDPTGLEFTPHAELVVRVAGPVDIAPGTYTVYHVYADGHVETLNSSVSREDGITTFLVNVPGFSEYDWDDVPEAGGPDGP